MNMSVAGMANAGCMRVSVTLASNYYGYFRPSIVELIGLDHSPKFGIALSICRSRTICFIPSMCMRDGFMRYSRVITSSTSTFIT